MGTTGLGPANDQWVADQGKWAHGWRRVVFPAIFLAYLAQTGSAIPEHSHGAGLVAGYVILVAFAVGYLLVVPVSWQNDDARYPLLTAGLGVLRP